MSKKQHKTSGKHSEPAIMVQVMSPMLIPKIKPYCVRHESCREEYQQAIRLGGRVVKGPGSIRDTLDFRISNAHLTTNSMKKLTKATERVKERIKKMRQVTNE